MADQMINGLPVKTTTQAGDKALISGVAEEYLIDIDRLADIVLSKLTNKAFALDQGTMTLLAALNALNSKILPVKSSFYEQFEDGNDLNNFKELCVMRSKDTSQTSTITNKPDGLTAGFILRVVEVSSSNSILQIVIENGGDIWTRGYVNDAKLWREWKLITI